MSELPHSKRALYKATYAPVLPTVSDQRTVHPQRGIEKVAFVRNLSLREGEIRTLEASFRPGQDLEVEAAFPAIRAVAQAASPKATLSVAEELGAVDADTLARFGKLVADQRAATASRLQTIVDDLRSAHLDALNQRAIAAAPTIAAPVREADPLESFEASERTSSSGRVVRVTRSHRPSDQPGEPTISRVGVLPVASAAPLTAVAAEGARVTIAPIEAAIGWGAVHRPELYQELHTLAAEHSSAAFAYSKVAPATALAHVIPKVTELVQQTLASVDVLKERMAISPVGRLHLERLEMTPAGVERGELIHSVPLTPHETVNISHREWAVRSEEFAELTADAFEGYSETGVSEKDDVAQSVETQNKHSSALNINNALTASYMSVTLSSSVGYNSTSSDEQAKKDSRNHSIASTRKASARVKKDHKISFKVASASGTEDQSVRTLSNPTDQAIRIDYYQLMRKWKVELYRYDLRMTYDIAIPSPGADLLQRYRELAELDEEIETPFDFPVSVADITRETWAQYASMFQADVDGPLPDWMPFATHKEIPHKDEDQAAIAAFESLDFDIDSNYEVREASFSGRMFVWPSLVEDGKYYFNVYFDSIGSAQSGSGSYDSELQELIGMSGRLYIVYAYKAISSGTLNVFLTLGLKSSVYEQWQYKTWRAIRAAAEEQYVKSRQQLKDRRERLLEELAKWDGLTLRRMEREEVMKGVLRWLFGPGFDLVPNDVHNILAGMDPNDPMAADALDPSSLTNKQWRRVMEFGEFVKFLQQSIEWENLLFFTYPYFFGAPEQWRLQRFLEHDDALHRTFLRAGSARVVLTIRPGFEEAFVSMVESGNFGKLPGPHPYLTIAKEIQDYANTNYPGIPPANPNDSSSDDDTVEKNEQGVLQARWFEYIPTSALDVAVSTPLPDLA